MHRIGPLVFLCMGYNSYTSTMYVNSHKGFETIRYLGYVLFNTWRFATGIAAHETMTTGS